MNAVVVVVDPVSAGEVVGDDSIIEHTVIVLVDAVSGERVVVDDSVTIEPVKVES